MNRLRVQVNYLRDLALLEGAQRCVGAVYLNQ